MRTDFLLSKLFWENTKNSQKPTPDNRYSAPHKQNNIQKNITIFFHKIKINAWYLFCSITRYRTRNI